VLFPYIATSYMTIICFPSATNPFGMFPLLVV